MTSPSAKKGAPTVLRWLAREWDYLLIVACLLSTALAVGGIISATVDAIQQATVYR